MIQPDWDRRIRRAGELASSYPHAAEGLRFYARVATFQKGLYARIQQALADSSAAIAAPGSLRQWLEPSRLLPEFSCFLSVVGRIAPAPLARAAAGLSRRGPEEWQRAIEDFWRAEPETPLAAGEPEEELAGDLRGAIPRERLLAWIFLQPYAEFLAHRREPPSLGGTPPTCPLCGSKPIVGVLRTQGDGAKKSLICMLCAHEWSFRRMYCPACGEEREPQMAFYSAPEIAHVRIDVCDTCHTYLKSVDLTKTGLAVPVVDELATIPLDLWALEHGYEKLQTNLLGI